MIKKTCAEIYEGKNLRENLIQLNQMVKSESVLDDFLDEYYEHETCFTGPVSYTHLDVYKRQDL